MTILFIPSKTAFLLSAALLLGACACPARADDSPGADRSVDAAGSARGLVEEVLRKSGGDGEGSLGAWTRSIIDRALERAGEASSLSVPGETAPLPAERHADVFAARLPASAEVLIFTSLSVPAASWRQWARDAARSGAPLVLRGVAGNSLPETAKRIGARLGAPGSGLGQAQASIAIDPRLFRLFGIERVPAVVVVPGGVPPCESRGCSNDPAPPHDLVTGNIGLVAALEAVAAEGDAGRQAARAVLTRLVGEAR